ncbi:TlpA family protein disulfide reductase [Luteibacter sp. CQ10]|uniref:TlpA family protein disulfide reductase n=1 Tax=Luteibacter sp. CQ10 TaxID=2805821 RepID=UPI0034A13E68
MKRLAGIAALALCTVAQAAPPAPLASGDVAALLAPPSKGVKVIAIWALDCAYCEENLSALRAWQRTHADVDLVFVSTDAISQAGAMEARLKAANLDDVPSRAYADATPERLDFLIDPSWGGETPRTVAIRADGSKKAMSGALDADRIARLMR